MLVNVRKRFAFPLALLLTISLALPLPALAAGEPTGQMADDVPAQSADNTAAESGQAPSDDEVDGTTTLDSGETETSAPDSASSTDLSDASSASPDAPPTPDTHSDGDAEDGGPLLVALSSDEKSINGYADWNKTKAGMEALLGIRYTWGGCYPSTGFDCSGFVSWVEREIIGNKAFPTHVNTSANGMEKWCESGGYSVVASGSSPTLPGSAHPGDLVFFYDSSSGRYVHVAIVAEGQSVYQSWGSESHEGGYPYGVRHMTFTETMTDGAGLTPGAKRYDSWVVFRGSSEPGKVVVQKVDADTGSAQPQGGATLKGATYKLTCTTTGDTWTLTTDSSGHAEIDRLPLGDYTLQETSAPKGYQLNDKVERFTLSAGSAATRTHACNVSDKVITEDFEVKKVDQDTRAAIADTEYTVYRYRNAQNPTAIPAECGGDDTGGTWEEVDVHMTDADGTILLPDLPFGCYRITETCPEYHYAECGESELSSDYSYHFVVDGSHEQGQTHVWENMKIELECNVDKSTIAVTSAAFRTLDGDKLAVDNVSEETYRYTIGFDNGETNVRADQYTVVDPCEFNEQGFRLKEIYTPVVENDTDGLYNLWYQTNLTDPNKVYSEASATLTNPENRLSDGTDRISTKGYKLWSEGLDCSQRSKLSVSDLKLADGEYITSLMLEFGSVEVGFTTSEDKPLAYFVAATEALDNADGEIVIRNSVTSHITRNYMTQARDKETGELVDLEEPIGLYDDDEDEVETRIIDTFLLGSSDGGSSSDSTSGLAKTGDSAVPVIVGLMLATAAALVLTVAGIGRVKALFSRR